MPLFTAESAVIAGQKGAYARWHAPKPPPSEPLLTEPVTDSGDHARVRLDRVRAQLDRVDAMMLTEDDPAKLDRLASAQARLSEQERILAGRPLPGSFRPQSDKSSRRQNRAVEVWSDEAPQQVVSSVPPNAPTSNNTPPPVQGPENG